MSNPDFNRRVLDWFERHGRKDLPWQQQPTPYRVWVSEIMLQQTQVMTVIPYYQRFMQRFPDITTLAQAGQDQVLHYWSGLGYYARARHLHAAAKLIVKQHAGSFPDTLDAVLALPGVGRSTAGAILSLAYGQRHPILDGNVKRVLTRYHAVAGWPGQSGVLKTLWELAERHTPVQTVAEYTQAMMDLGATVCTRTRPVCEQCPVSTGCKAYATASQADFPAARPRKRLPVRKTAMLLCCNDRYEVIMEKRPPAGIWGGLWSFPEPGPDSVVDSWCRDEMGLSVTLLEEWPVVRHTFSHFHLDITPVLVQADGHQNNLGHEGIREADNRLWYSAKGTDELGFAAPVEKLLQRFSDWQQERML
jgi:A/G-specific adenine glycosylase